MKHNFYAVFATFAFFMVSVVQLIAQNATPTDEFTYCLNSDCTGIVIGKYEIKEKDVVIPSTIEGYPVVEISCTAFLQMDPFGQRIESITIPNSVKKLEALHFSDAVN